MTPRVTSQLLVSALVRRVEAAGGFGAVLARGDPTAGAVLLLLAERGRPTALVERRIGPDDRQAWTRAGPEDLAAVDDYVARRRAGDPDLWLVELDAADAAAIADELIA